MEPHTSHDMPGERRPWVAPRLVRHESLVALTRQYVDPATGQPLDPGAAQAQDIPCSTAFCPA